MFSPVAWDDRRGHLGGGRGGRDGRGLCLSFTSSLRRRLALSLYICVCQQDIDLEHYEMKEEPVEGKKSEDDGIEKENLAVLEKIRKNQRQDHLNVSAHSVRWLSLCLGEDGGQIHQSD